MQLDRSAPPLRTLDELSGETQLCQPTKAVSIAMQRYLFRRVTQRNLRLPSNILQYHNPSEHIEVSPMKLLIPLGGF